MKARDFRQNSSIETTDPVRVIITAKQGDWMYWVATAILILATVTMDVWAPLISK